MSCLKHKRNVNSQNGEDGIIEYIFNKLNIKNGNFLEFGAWDGKLNSNCLKLFNEGWSGIFIEGDPEKFKDLEENFKNFDQVTCILEYVSYGNSNNLDSIIDRSGHKNLDFDIFCIDVDGLDYNIFKDLNKNLPKVVCIEINSGHSPLYEEILPEEISKDNIGQSIKVISDLAAEKGYFPLCYTGNLFLIKNEYKEIFREDLKDLKSIYLDFLYHLNPRELDYLYNFFILNKDPDITYFKNDIMEEFFRERLTQSNKL
jgi:hypothetical protein